MKSMSHVFYYNLVSNPWLKYTSVDGDHISQANLADSILEEGLWPL